MANVSSFDMPFSTEDKKLILSQLIHDIDLKLASLGEELADLNRSIGEETKSSAGDKFETSREMINQNIDQINQRINRTKLIRNQVQGFSIGFNKSVTEGSLVQTDNGHFFMGVSWGTMNFKDQKLHVISFNSPMGKVMYGKQKGDSITFNNKPFQILNIL